MLREDFGTEFGISVAWIASFFSRDRRVGSPHKGRDNRELNVEPLKYDQSTNGFE